MIGFHETSSRVNIEKVHIILIDISKLLLWEVTMDNTQNLKHPLDIIFLDPRMTKNYSYKISSFATLFKINQSQYQLIAYNNGIKKIK